MEIIMENTADIKRARAKKRMEELKGFYIHTAVFTVINIFILGNILVQVNYNADRFWRFEHFFTFTFWGLGLLFHAAKVFRFNPFFGKDWEKRQIARFMEKERKEMDKAAKKF
ncbi:Hypothetical protein I595_10 [Croceitalea dokdonensis DOKDO 023]|uniref:2TM domain-containing protein n=1 Tax=Croceitalea dokdonensis DOKDO 023 TaxID=1300341 RepID=A0A0N8H4E0_9FLAO|nr:2TM domain-containing protein [Croceitalea dokdonensis]KPM33108.1 Hypothetical protein I595_10 [Croceitalea dokdonensis DOKDO 023]